MDEFTCGTGVRVFPFPRGGGIPGINGPSGVLSIGPKHEDPARGLGALAGFGQLMFGR